MDHHLSNEELLELLKDGVQVVSGFSQCAGVDKTPTAEFCYKAGLWAGKSLMLIGELETAIKSDRR